MDHDSNAAGLNRLEKVDGEERCSRSSENELSEYVPGRGFERYKNSLKNFKPLRKKKNESKTMPIDDAGLFSIIGISWMSKYMHKAYSTGITVEELPAISPYDTCTYNGDRLELLWKNELAKNGPEKASFAGVAWRFCQTRIFGSTILYILSLVSGFLVPTVLMRQLLQHIQSGDGSYWEGMKWVFLLTTLEISRTLFIGWARGINDRTGVRLRSACMTLVYRKIIRVNNLGNISIGEVINLFSNDAQRISDMLLHGPTIIGAPIMTAWGIFYILWLFSPMALLGMVVFLLYYIVQYKISDLTRYFRSKTVKISDMRIRLMNEILDCIKLIKMYAWEKRFNQDILDLRKREQQVLVKSSYCQGFSVSMGPTIPIISSIVAFLGHIYGGNNLTVAQAFPLSAFFGGQIKQALTQLREGSQSIVDTMIAFRRIKGVLLLEDGQNYSISKPIIKSQAVAINHATFSCITFGYQDEASCPANEKKRKQKGRISGDKSENEKLAPTNDAKYVDILFDVSFEATKGKLVGICGHVGSGKSSLLLAALGQLRLSDGQVARDGTCAYVSQQAWITNATLRENILFGTGFDRTRYNKAIYACNLDQDIDTMPGGDQTEIGEKGVNLSGGQKQRVALARALYADRDIYFLDDPLSAVDARVGSHIFENLILGALAGKTVLFVTHQIQYLNRCDDIYMMQDGRIIEHGRHEELMKLGNEYASMVTAIAADCETHSTQLGDQKIEALSKLNADVQAVQEEIPNAVAPVRNEGIQKSQSPGTQSTAEKLRQGTIKAHTYQAYIGAAGGYSVSFIVVLISLLTVGSTAFSSWWLALWIKAGGGNTIVVQNDNETIYSDNINDNPEFWYYQAVYAATIGIILLASLLRTLVFTKATIGASTRLHNELFKRIIYCPMRFFETTPTGRIQHLFSRDMDEVDNRLPGTLTKILQNTFIILFAVLSICMVFPWFILPLCILVVIYYFFSKIFRVGVRDLKRMENKSRVPIISFITTTVQGLSTIHAFEKEADSIKRFNRTFDESSKCLFMYLVASRWLTIRIDSISVAIIGITAFLVLSLKDEVSPALAGLALSYAVHISGAFQHTTRLLSEIDVRLISVEAINHYLRTLKREGVEKYQTIQPPSSWPAAPKIKFSNVRMAYGDGAPIILKGISLSIEAGERIGIVGRTGSGKSSLAVALFRLAELSDGKIEIDDVDISEISLHQLRTKLSSIPQDPILFSGSIRSNLDPFKLRTDAEIWQALEKTELKSRVESITGGLDASVGFGGDNLSVGERQLLCLARALLRDSKILVLDEATASVDPETEILVQKAIQQEFPGCTILTIAHRLQTVLSLDRILVMNGGEVLEFDTPSNLLANQSSEFSKMLAAAEQAENQ